MENTNLALVLPRPATIYCFSPLGEGIKPCAGVVPFSPAQRGAGLPHHSRPASPICATICDHPVHDTFLQPPSHPSPCSWDTSRAQNPQIYKPLPRHLCTSSSSPFQGVSHRRPSAFRGGRGLCLFPARSRPSWLLLRDLISLRQTPAASTDRGHLKSPCAAYPGHSSCHAVPGSAEVPKFLLLPAELGVRSPALNHGWALLAVPPLPGLPEAPQDHLKPLIRGLRAHKEILKIARDQTV